MTWEADDLYKNIPKRKICLPVADDVILTQRPFSKRTPLRPKQLKQRDAKTEFSEQDVSFILSLQTACFENIFPNLRLISLAWDEKYLNLYFYVDGELLPDDREAISLVETYFISDLANPLACELEINRIDTPMPVHFLGECIFARRENPILAQPPLRVIREKCTNRRAKVKIIFLRALIGFVFPRLRMVDVIWDDVSAEAIFIVDGELSEDDKKCIEEISRRAWEQFPKEELLHWSTKTIRLDFPEMPSERKGGCVYWRKEFPSM